MKRVDPEVSAYFSQMGSRGGKKSRRQLSAQDAKNMVHVREARRAFKRFYTRCFWYMPRDLVVTIADLPEIIRGLRTHGGREGFFLADKLCH